MASKPFVMAEEYAAPDSEAVVALVLHSGTARTAGKWCDRKLYELREKPDEFLRWAEDALLRGLSAANVEPGAEHTKSTGRRAGGGTLRKGS